ncbi:MAG: hypothetical protein ABI645_00005 [Pseudomonadota bacterium]
MIWHIFRKDARLLWPLALSVVSLQALCALLTWVLGHFEQPAQLAPLARNLPLLIYLGIGVLGVVVVHQDPLSSERADWLVRPIKRSDLALSKVLFMALLVSLPILLVDIAQQLALHFQPRVSIGVAASRAAALFVVVSLPALAVGAVSRSLADAVVFGITSIIALTLVEATAFTALRPGQLAVEVTWIAYACAGLVLLLGAVVTLAFQYATRRTFAARGIILISALAVLCVLLGLPRGALMFLQDQLWGRPADSGIALAFDPDSQTKPSEAEPLRLRPSSHVTPAKRAAYAAEFLESSEQVTQIGLPLRLSGMNANDVLFADGIRLRIISLSGAVLYQGWGVCFRLSNGVGVNCLQNSLEVWAPGERTSSTPVEQYLKLPRAVYVRLENQPVRLEIAYDLTRFLRQPKQIIGAIGSVQPLRHLGSCATRIDNDGDEVELRCLSNIAVPSCAAVFLEETETNARNPELHLCAPNYAPYHRSGIEDAVGRSNLTLPFRDPSGLARYPVGSDVIQRARIVFAAYEPSEHFHRTVVISSIRLGDWALGPKNTGPPAPGSG